MRRHLAGYPATFVGSCLTSCGIFVTPASPSPSSSSAQTRQLLRCISSAIHPSPHARSHEWGWSRLLVGFSSLSSAAMCMHARTVTLAYRNYSSSSNNNISEGSKASSSSSGGGGGSASDDRSSNAQNKGDTPYGGGLSVPPGQQKPSLREMYPPSDVELPESSFLKCIEKEIMDEKLRFDKEEGGPPIPSGWEMHHTPGTSFFYGRRLWIPPTEPMAGSSAGESNQEGSEGEGKRNDKDDDDTAEGKARGRAGPPPRAIERHYIRVQLTTRDPSLDPECDLRGEHFPFSFFVQRVKEVGEAAADGADTSTTTGQWNLNFPESGTALNGISSGDNDDGMEEELSLYKNSVECRCDLIDGELIVDNVVMHGIFEIDDDDGGSEVGKEGEGAGAISDPPVSLSASEATTGMDTEKKMLRKKVSLNDPFGGYPGPDLDETEEEVLDGIQTWLAERNIDDQFGEFIGQYSVWIEQAEYEQWLQQLHDYVAA